MLQRRNGLPKTEILRRSEIIQNHVINCSEYKSARIIGVYFPTGSEVRTEHIITTALMDQKLLLLPKTGIDQIAFHPVCEADFRENRLIKGRFGIMEPAESSHSIEENIDLLIVPGVAFDKYGYRIGYGKGYYDRFIKKNNCHYCIGLGFQFQLLYSSIPSSHFDQKLDAIAMESSMLVC
ncbi:MAG TPA: 5-formyltetrahydrofolate cyclo-ligase [Nitrososphaeraceae archaeon]|nr:5-formyltetrahydrofolate cyclo-ligase [Nitrososphaeraceae archaeon]